MTLTKKIPIFPALLTIIMLAMISYNIFDFYTVENKRIEQYRKVIDHQPVAKKFQGLEDMVTGISYVSYISDMDIESEEGKKDYTQAQYTIIPAILDPNNFSHPYAILNYKNQDKAWANIKALNLEPLRRNSLGVILARPK